MNRSASVKLKYRYKLILYFLLVLSVVVLAFVIFIRQRDKNYNLEILQTKLKIYNQLVYNEITRGKPYDSLGLPATMRLTIIDTASRVLYDNSEYPQVMAENHLDRPEIKQAAAGGSGTALRHSGTLKTDYLYYARHYPGLYIRTALEYKTEVLPKLNEDRKYFIIIFLLFLVLVLFLILITKRLTRPIESFTQFIDIVDSPDKDYSRIKFPNDEFGEVGKKVIGAFHQLEQTKLYKQQMSHNIAHELKTPVTGIMAYLETVLHNPHIQPDEILYFIEKAHAQTLRLSCLINDVSTLNKIDEGPDKFVIEKINLYDCIEDIKEDVEYKLKANRIRLEMLFSSDLTLYGNYSLLYSLFKNLIDNSIEHAGGDITVSIAAGIQQISGDKGYKIRFTYTDTGKGIPPENLPRIFERFYRVEEGRSRKTGGSGLGLAIVKNAVLFHKGTISAENRPGGGIIFKFTLYSLNANV